jgi:hypothetical protein
MTPTGPILVEANVVYGVWAVHPIVLPNGAGHAFGSTYAVTHVPSGMRCHTRATFEAATALAHMLSVDCPSATLIELITKGHPVRERAKAHALGARLGDES